MKPKHTISLYETKTLANTTKKLYKASWSQSYLMKLYNFLITD